MANIAVLYATTTIVMAMTCSWVVSLYHTPDLGRPSNQDVAFALGLAVPCAFLNLAAFYAFLSERRARRQAEQQTREAKKQSKGPLTREEEAFRLLAQRVAIEDAIKAALDTYHNAMPFVTEVQKQGARASASQSGVPAHVSALRRRLPKKAFRALANYIYTKTTSPPVSLNIPIFPIRSANNSFGQSYEESTVKETASAVPRWPPWA
ncbi:hypothetical protein F5Y18DRAFT_429716 [Xylariaceae sp. FL1019]|nr:hypothetical protein F5Y18DRAFT_429716 [Xylariaceae sp. FL1019]